MDKKPLCSIVMPVYNGEDCVHIMLDSLLAQTYENWELYAVNDGSTDSTEKILQKYYLMDSRINIISQKNQGAGSARITGIMSITGKYVSVIDADDKLSPDYLEKLVSEIESTNSDMVWCDIHCNNDSVGVWRQNFEENVDSMIRGIMIGTQWAASWNRIFKADILKLSVKYVDGLNQWDDTVLNVAYLLHCSKIKYLPIGLYYYNTENENSLTHTVAQRNVIAEYIKAVSGLEAALNDVHKLDAYKFELEHRKLYAIRDFIDNKTCRNYRRFVETYPDAIKNIWDHSEYPSRLKISSWFILHGMNLMVPFICKIDSLYNHLFIKKYY